MSVKHTYITADGPETKVITKAKAIRLKCMDCSGFQPGEIQKCTCYDCPLYPFRFGNEKGLERIYISEEDEQEGNEEVEEKKVEIKPKKMIKKKIIKKVSK